MAQSDPNSEDALDGLVGRVKSRRAEGRSVSAPVQHAGGLKPSDILFMPGEQKKIIYYLSHHQYACLADIQQMLGMDQEQVQKIIATFRDAGYIQETIRDGEVYYHVKFVDTTNRKSSLPNKLWNALSIDSTDFLRQLPLFNKLTETDIRHIGQQFKQEHYLRNAVIVRQGDPSRSFFIIKSGVVAVSNLSSGGEYNLLRYLEQGDFFGESGLLTGQSVSATVMAFTPADILIVDKNDFYALLSNHAGVTIELARTLAYRQSDVTARLANKSGGPNLFLVIGAGKHAGATTIANALALMIATSKTSTALLEFPGAELPTSYGFSPGDEIFSHPGGFQILNPKSRPGLSEQERVVLAVDQASRQYKNIILDVSWELIEHSDSLIRRASQIVLVASPRQDDWVYAQKVIASLKPNIRTNKTRLFTIINHSLPAISGDPSEAIPDFSVPFLDTLPSLAERKLEHIPQALTAVLIKILKLLGYTNQVGIYIPKALGADQQDNTSAYVDKTLAFMGKLFGRATHENIQGVQNSQETGLVEEDIHLVRSFCSQAVLDKHMGEVVDYVETLKKELQQETMALEVNQKLMLV